jgi:uncharacterized membrane protein YfcA
MEILGYITSLLIGISLGIIGGGGSVLTVPILVYFFHIEPVLATVYSLFIVGTTSAVAALQKFRKSEIDFRVAFIFGFPSLLTVFLIRKCVISQLPDIIYQNSEITVYKGPLTLILFSLLLISAAIGMLRPQQIKRPVLPEAPGLVLLGVSVGLISGLLGAGGGFIIIPALLFYASLNMRTAIGTSLFIISLNSLVGFTGDLPHHDVDWIILSRITALAVAGTFIGLWISGRIAGERIKKIFGWFILTTGIFILIKELLF